MGRRHGNGTHRRRTGRCAAGVTCCSLGRLPGRLLLLALLGPGLALAPAAARQLLLLLRLLLAAHGGGGGGSAGPTKAASSASVWALTAGSTNVTHMTVLVTGPQEQHHPRRVQNAKQIRCAGCRGGPRRSAHLSPVPAMTFCSAGTKALVRDPTVRKSMAWPLMLLAFLLVHLR